MRDTIELQEYRGARDFDARRDFPSQRSRAYMDEIDYRVGRDYGRPVSGNYAPAASGRRYSPEMRLSIESDSCSVIV